MKHAELNLSFQHVTYGKSNLACLNELNLLAYMHVVAQVYAPTFPGYGRSEKQSLAYSQELWRDFLRDFVLEVVQRPVVIAGNSIGGFISASLAADYPSLVKGVLHMKEA